MKVTNLKRADRVKVRIPEGIPMDIAIPSNYHYKANNDLHGMVSMLVSGMIEQYESNPETVFVVKSVEEDGILLDNLYYYLPEWLEKVSDEKSEEEIQAPVDPLVACQNKVRELYDKYGAEIGISIEYGRITIGSALGTFLAYNQDEVDGIIASIDHLLKHRK